MITILTFFDEIIFFYVLFTVRTVSSAWMTSFYISSQIESLIALMYIVNVKMSDFNETVYEISSLAVRVTSMNIVLKIFVIDSFKSELLFFCLLLRISTQRNLLIFLTKMSDCCLMTLLEISTCKKCLIFNNIFVDVLLKLTSVNFDWSIIVFFSNNDVTAEWELADLNSWICESDFWDCFNDSAIVMILCDHSTDFQSERMFKIYLWSQRSTVSSFSFSANLTVWFLIMHFMFEIQNRYCFVIFLMYFMKILICSLFMNLLCLFFDKNSELT